MVIRTIDRKVRKKFVTRVEEDDGDLLLGGLWPSLTSKFDGKPQRHHRDMPFDLRTQMFTDPLGLGLSLCRRLSNLYDRQIRAIPDWVSVGQTKPLRGRSPELADLAKENRPIAITDRATGLSCLPPTLLPTTDPKLGQLIITSEARLRRKFERNLWTVNYGLTVAVYRSVLVSLTKMIFIPKFYSARYRNKILAKHWIRSLKDNFWEDFVKTCSFLFVLLFVLYLLRARWLRDNNSRL